MPRRIRNARFGRELDAIDHITAIGRQFDIADLFIRRGTGLCELARHTTNLHHRRGTGKGQHHRHLQEEAEKIADIIGGMFGKALGAIAALQEEGFASSDFRECLFELARFTGKDEWRKTGKLRLNRTERGGIRKSGHLLDRLRSPA